VMGAGNRLFEHTSNPNPVRPKPLRLIDSRTVGDSLTYLTYTRIPAIPTKASE